MIVELPKNPKILRKNEKDSEIYSGEPIHLKKNDQVKFFESDWKCIIPLCSSMISLSDWNTINRVIDNTHVDILVQ